MNLRRGLRLMDVCQGGFQITQIGAIQISIHDDQNDNHANQRHANLPDSADRRWDEIILHCVRISLRRNTGTIFQLGHRANPPRDLRHTLLAKRDIFEIAADKSEAKANVEDRQALIAGNAFGFR